MSSPIDDDGSNDRLKYAPPWARQQLASDDAATMPTVPGADAAPSPQSQTTEPCDHPRDLDLPPVPALEVAESPNVAPPTEDPAGTWLRAPARTFEGDRAVRELRARMALDPQVVPEPPELKSSRFQWKAVLRALAITTFAAGAALVVVMFAFPEAKQVKPARQEFAPPAVVSAKTDRAASAETHRTEPARLVLIEKRRAAMNERVPLGVTLAGGPGHGAVLISGLAAGTQLSAGAAIGSGTWRVPLADLGQVQVIPPTDFAGVMDITAALLAADAKVVDKSFMRIEWASADASPQFPASESPGRRDDAPPSAAPLKQPDLLTLERKEIESLVQRGRDFIANGDLAAARLVLRRAANGGDAQAALLLGTTFDPATFEKLNVIGATPDPAEARAWYQRAIELGSTEAERRLAPLARGTR